MIPRKRIQNPRTDLNNLPPVSAQAKSGLDIALTFLGLSTLLIAVPLLSTLGRGTAFFVAHDASGQDILQFTLAVFLIPPLILWLIHQLVSFVVPSFAQHCYSLLLAALLAAWLASSLKPNTITLLGASLLIGVGVFFPLLQRLPDFIGFLRYLGWISPIVPLFFLFFTPVNVLLDSTEAAGHESINSRSSPVVVLVLDELPLNSLLDQAGNIDAKRLPNFARLANISTWYSNTTTVSSLTDRAVPALLSGRHAEAGRAPVYQNYRQNLFTVLAPSHSVQAAETATRLCPRAICDSKSRDTRPSSTTDLYHDAVIVYWHSVLAKPLAARYLPSIAGRWHGFQQTGAEGKADKSGGAAFAFFDMQRNKGKRFTAFARGLAELELSQLHYFHLSLPHSPWFYLPDGSLYNGSEIPGRSSTDYAWLDNAFLVDQGVLRYSLQLEYVDRLVGELLDEIQKSPVFEDAMLIVLADHGVGFEAGQSFREPVDSTLSDIARIPLFIKYPDQQKGSREDKPAQTIDLLPTIADTLALPLSETVDGQALRSTQWRAPKRSILEAELSNERFERLLNATDKSSRLQQSIHHGQSAIQSIGQGQGASYVGTDISTLPVSGRSDIILELSHPDWYNKVQATSGFLPARLEATLKGSTESTDVLIALNGLAAGSGTSFNNDQQLSIMLRPDLFQTGKNQISAFAVDGDQLQPITIGDHLKDYRLALDKDGNLREVQLAGQRWHRAKKDEGIHAEAKLPRKRSSLALLSGWAYDRDRKEPAERILLIDGDTIVTDSFRRTINPLISEVAGLGKDVEVGFIISLGSVYDMPNPSLVLLFSSGKMLTVDL